MQAFEYLVGLVSILIGIALSDIAFSLHRLLRAGSSVRWHWHAPLAAMIVVLLVLDMWWGLRQLERANVTMTIGLFLPMLGSLFAFFLLAAAALPDAVPGDGIDLRAYYIGNIGYFWSLFIIFILLACAHQTVIYASLASLTGPGAWRALSTLLPNLVAAALAGSLIAVRRGWWHGSVLLLLLAALLSSYLTRPLT